MPLESCEKENSRSFSFLPAIAALALLLGVPSSANAQETQEKEKIQTEVRNGIKAVITNKATVTNTDSFISLDKDDAPKPSIPIELRLGVDFKNPLEDHEALAKLTWSLNRTFALGTRELASLADNHLGVRLGTGILNAFFQTTSHWLSHEYAHHIDPQLHDYDKGMTFDSSQKQALVPLPFPIFPREVHHFGPRPGTLEERTIHSLQIDIGGINQNSFQRRHAYLTGLLKEQPSPNEAYDYLLNSLNKGGSAFGYLVYSLSSNHAGNPIDDLGSYVSDLRELSLIRSRGQKKTEFSRTRMLLPASLATFGSVELYRSAIALLNELIEVGEGSVIIPQMPRGIRNNGIELTFPHFGYWLTPEGDFFNMRIDINPSASQSFAIELGTDCDFLQSDLGPLGLNRLRPALEWTIQKSLTKDFDARLTLQGALDLERSSGKITGWMTGTRSALLFRRIGITASLIWHKNDVMEDLVKQRPPLDLRFGVEATF